MGTQVILTVEGMSCEKCEQKIIKAISTLSGVELVEVSVEHGKVTVIGGDLDASELSNVIEELGYTVIFTK